MGSLYEMITKLCEQRGIRPGRLCDELSISRGLITDLKMGRKKGVSAETAQKIAAFFGVSVGYLLGQEESSDVLDEVDISFYGEYKELDDEQKEAVRAMVRAMRSRRQPNQENQ
ncbi:MAG: helix-turn-helix transcriptional regulator [Oscillospiraceae bacterium]|nr:helix-turn-helix transcriptional regulator [Oscillospiraceae bacterium]